MYSTAGPDGQTVTLQLRETDETIELPASMLSKMSRQTDTATLSISYQDSSEVLTDGTIDLLLATTPLHSTGFAWNPGTIEEQLCVCHTTTNSRVYV